ncbi:MAG: purine-nucleoside phosphorylase [bacterium]|nr:purine-nucleoside phosphorylase [bacterium]
MTNNQLTQVFRARDYISKRIKTNPEIGIILGSGLGAFADELKNPVKIPYATIPGFRKSEVKGHSNELYIGNVSGKTVAIMKGRYHYYEGYSLFDVTFPTRVLHSLGVNKVIVTNAAGSLKLKISPGNILLIKDHINLSARNPLIGLSPDFGEKFIDLTDAYSNKLRKIAERTAKEEKIPLKSGVYVFLTGPSYETVSEIKMLAKLGGDVVGMSTVPEVITANQLGMEVLGISSVTNYGTGLTKSKVNHKEVIDVNKRTAIDFIRLLKAVIKNI